MERQAEASLERSRVDSKASKNGEQTVSGGLKCSMTIVTGDWDKSGLYYIVTEKWARMLLMIIHKTEMYIMHLCIWLKKSPDRKLKVSAEYF